MLRGTRHVCSVEDDEAAYFYLVDGMATGALCNGRLSLRRSQAGEVRASGVAKLASEPVTPAIEDR